MYATNKMGIWADSGDGISNITNYGVMGSINYGANSNTMSVPLTLNNLGLIGAKDHTIEAKNNSKILIQNYMVQISETAMIFNSFKQNSENNFSHLVISANSKGNISFKDSDSKIILGFGEKFQEGEGYLISKLATDTGGSAYSDLSVDFDRLVPQSDIYTLYKQGEYFIARLQPQHSAISNLHKSNIRTMNNFYTLSNSMIYPRKLYHSQNLTRKNQNNLVILREQSDRRISKNNIIDSSPKAQNDNIMLDSAIPLKSYESFSYRNESVNRRIQRQNKRNYNRRLPNQSNSQNLKENQRNLQNLNADSANKMNKTNQNNLRDSANRDYYFILTPFINHNYFFESGRYNLSGLEYGFLTAFSTQVAESNSLGAHFIFSYGSLGDKQDKDLSIKNLNLNVGINYKLDLIYDMYLKSRGDFFYFLNQVKTLTMLEAIKPNNLGFGASVTYGKDFNFGKGGILGIEVGIDYKALKTNEVSLNLQSYKQSLLNLIYADLGINYSKYFGGFGINFGTGFKANLAPKLAESALLINTQNLRFVLDNDKYLAYANAGISYLLNTKNFDMEFSLAYYGNFGDRVISNGGGVEWRVLF